jgi:hypothetical protein
MRPYLTEKPRQFTSEEVDAGEHYIDSIGSLGACVNPQEGNEEGNYCSDC